MREMDVSLSKKTEQGIYIFKLSGSLGVEGSRGMSRLFDVCLKEKVHKIIIDMTEIDFVSGDGMGLFFSVVGDLRENGGDIIFLCMPDKIKDIFSTLHVLDYFENYISEGEAVKALSSGVKVKFGKKPSKRNH